MDIKSIITNPFVLLFLSIVLGQYLGKLEYKNFKLGSSGGLFVGIFLSYTVTKWVAINGNVSFGAPFVTKDLFSLSLIGFIASVGLIASKNIKQTIKKNGLKFVFLAFVITFTGACLTLIFAKSFTHFSNASIIGTYVGSLTSSPGLATALEMAKNSVANSEALVGLGYSISYVPGVAIVIIFAQFMGKKYTKQGKNDNTNDNITESKNTSFDIIAFSFVCLTGVLLGKVKIYLGSFIGNFALGSTGGVLIMSLILGEVKKIGSMNFSMSKKSLSVVRDISLNMFLAIVGLNYGYNAVSLIQSSGLQLLLFGLTTGSLSVFMGYVVGKFVLKLNVIHLIGGICGGMTSTPGLAASIEAVNSEEVTVGYGATYPFALFFMILFTNILFKI
ncbi:YidE/YbjL duplication [Clostridium sp. 'deep sea']|uniref:aspartate-alanine antiporter-like transporter n=1 Tax=Clostridium sp. 'deep sea' TaxID=2779445 RepID=UPI0018966E6D|nr:YidE/YbjL duplication [Clostridium sp. 'deep sea']QOR34217.1 YidE/YbjL duplication [Clostridium sp. 'deep sea']